MESLEVTEELENQQQTIVRSAKKRKFIKSSVTVHDKTQIETAFDYKLSSIPTQKNSFWASFFNKNQCFEVDAYIFFPPQMGVEESTYDKKNFYQDLKPLTRLKEPRYSYKDFIGTSSKKIISPLLKIQTLIYQLKDCRLKDRSSYESEIVGLAKIFACSYSSYFLKRVNRRCKKLVKHIDHENKNQINNDLIFEKKLSVILGAFDPLLKRSRYLLEEWEEIVELSKRNGMDHEYLTKELSFVLEYCHYRFREGLAKLVFSVDQCLELHTFDSVQKVAYRLRIWSRWEALVFRKKNYLWIDETSSLAMRESYALHINFLKKRIWQVLNLFVKPRTSIAFKQQISYMFAAGLAALWAFGANIFIWYELKFGGFSTFENLDSFLGLSGTLVTLAFVFSYILKDRIKEIGRLKLGGGLFGKRPDYDEKVWLRHFSGKMTGIGTVKEWIKFISKPTLVPSNIMSLRDSLAKNEQLDDESIIYYKKRLELDAVKILGDKLPFFALRDIIRFNVRGHLSTLGDCKQSYLSLSKTTKAQLIEVPKVYYLDMILKYTFKNNLGEMEQLGFDCNRLVVNKDGLVRVDSI